MQAPEKDRGLNCHLSYAAGVDLMTTCAPRSSFVGGPGSEGTEEQSRLLTSRFGDHQELVFGVSLVKQKWV